MDRRAVRTGGDAGSCSTPAPRGARARSGASRARRRAGQRGELLGEQHVAVSPSRWPRTGSTEIMQRQLAAAAARKRTRRRSTARCMKPVARGLWARVPGLIDSIGLRRSDLRHRGDASRSWSVASSAPRHPPRARPSARDDDIRGTVASGDAGIGVGQRGLPAARPASPFVGCADAPRSGQRLRVHADRCGDTGTSQAALEHGRPETFRIGRDEHGFRVDRKRDVVGAVAPSVIRRTRRPARTRGAKRFPRARGSTGTADHGSSRPGRGRAGRPRAGSGESRSSATPHGSTPAPAWSGRARGQRLRDHRDEIHVPERRASQPPGARMAHSVAVQGHRMARPRRRTPARRSARNGRGRRRAVPRRSAAQRARRQRVGKRPRGKLEQLDLGRR